MAEDEVMGGTEATGAGGDRKRRATGQGPPGPSGAMGSGGPASSSKLLGNLPERVGMGDHEQPIMMAVLQGITELSMDVADLKGATYESYEGPAEWRYLKEAIDYKKSYGKKCQEVKGSGTVVGHAKNDVLAGMYMAYQRDPENSKEKKDRMEELVGKLLRDDGNKLDLNRARGLEKLVAHCQVIPGKKKSYVNLKMRDGPGEEVEKLLEEALLREGSRQWDPPPSRSVQRDLKTAMIQARKR